MFEFLFSAFTLGLLGSIHCVSMCGALSVQAALPKNTNQTNPYQPLVAWRKIAIYQTLRSLGYATMGALLASIGQHAALRINLSSRWVLICVIFLLLIAQLWAILKKSCKRPSFIPRIKPRPIAQFFARTLSFIQTRTKQSFMPALLGLFTPFIPCGLSASAYAIAMSTFNPFHGFLVMLVFSIGGLASLSMVQMNAHFILKKINPRVLIYVRVAMILISFFFLFRHLTHANDLLNTKNSTPSPTHTHCH